MLILYHARTSTTSQKVRLCLEEKKLKWESRLINIGNLENLSENYLQINSDGIVPTLDHDGKIIAESSVINEYIDEVFPQNPLMPTSSYLKTLVRTACIWQFQLHHPYVRMLTYFSPNSKKLNIKAHAKETLIQEANDHPIASRKSFLLHAYEGITDKDIQQAFYETTRLLNKLEKLLKTYNGPYFIGNQFTLADIAWIPIFNRLEELGYSSLWIERESNLLTHWWTTVKQRSSYQSAILQFHSPT